MYKNILVPLDGSELAEAAIGLATAIAKATVARLCLAHVQDSSPIARAQLPDPASYLARMAEAPSAELLESVDVAVIHPDNGAYLCRKETAAHIAAHAQKHGFDLIVVSTRGHSGIRRVFEGSVAEALLRASPCPVLFCGPRPGVQMLRPGPHPIRRLLISLDQSEGSESILESALDFAKAMKAEVTLLHVLEPLRPFVTVAGVDQRGYSTEEWEQLHARADAYLTTIRQQLEAAQISSTTETTVSNDVAGSVLETADRTNADIIALASSAPHGLVRALLGSVGDRLVRNAPCPVLITRARA
jgi:nucleotide-binding universal stress UspA family protein